jgi:hypothetical protein
MTSLPHSLVRFEGQFEHAIERDLRLRATRRLGRRALRLALAGAVAAGVGLGAFSLVPGSGPSAVARAAAALRDSGGTILHIDMAVHETGDTGSSSTYTEETWQEASAPFTYRSVRTENGVRIDVVTHNDGSSELYDATTNTIYSVTSGGLREVKQSQLPPAPPAAKLRPASPSEAPMPIGKPSLNPAPEPGTQSAADDPLRARVLGILQSGLVSEEGHVTVDGRDALKLASTDGTATIFIDPQTYEPILWQMSGGPNGAGLSAHFDVYQRLADTQANATLFDLRAQHQGARVDTSPADYAAALARLSGER